MAAAPSQDYTEFEGNLWFTGSEVNNDATTQVIACEDFTVTATDDVSITATDDMHLLQGSTDSVVNLGTAAYAADINVFDPSVIAPQMPVVEYDLPAGARRLVQKSDGIAATVVNGAIVLRDGVATGNLPGQLIRGPLAG